MARHLLRHSQKGQIQMLQDQCKAMAEEPIYAG
jgi:hypothetical protein